MIKIWASKTSLRKAPPRGDQTYESRNNNNNRESQNVKDIFQRDISI